MISESAMAVLQFGPLVLIGAGLYALLLFRS